MTIQPDQNPLLGLALAELLDFLSEKELLECPGLDIIIHSDENGRGRPSISISEPWTPGEKDWGPRDRELKRVFGPFTPEGTPPYVCLVGGAQLPSFYLRVRWTGVYTCEITGHREEEMGENEIKYKEDSIQSKLAEIQSLQEEIGSGVKSVSVYDCKPKQRATT